MSDNAVGMLLLAGFVAMVIVMFGLVALERRQCHELVMKLAETGKVIQLPSYCR